MFPEELMLELTRLAERLRVGSYITVAMKQLSSPLLKLVESPLFPMSFVCNTYVRIDPTVSTTLPVAVSSSP
jgi:hypothetical protein